MKNKIFISHAIEDVKTVESFIDNILKLGCDIPANRIFCSSMIGHGIEGGQYIPNKLKEEINQSGIVLLFISKAYKQSEVCLNELGAAWVALEEKKVIPLLLPDVDFKEIGFLKENHLGIKLENDVSIKQLIHDKKLDLNPDYNPNILHKHTEEFCKGLGNAIESKPIYSEEQLEYIECFDKSLYPFGEVLSKTIPHLGTGIHHIEDENVYQRIFQELASWKSENRLWYRMADGDMYIESFRQLLNGNWLIGNMGWEVKIGDMWVSHQAEMQNDFIFIKAAELPPYQINSDVGGESFSVGILQDGTVVSENERQNGYAILNGKTINLHEHGIEPRYRDGRPMWIFLGTQYHKVGGSSYRKVEQFCKEVDQGNVEVSSGELRKFLMTLRNDPTVIMWR